MENVEIAQVLSKYADLLEIEGEDLFRVPKCRAHHRKPFPTGGSTVGGRQRP